MLYVARVTDVTSSTGCLLFVERDVGGRFRSTADLFGEGLSPVRSMMPPAAGGSVFLFMLWEFPRIKADDVLETLLVGNEHKRISETVKEEMVRAAMVRAAFVMNRGIGFTCCGLCQPTNPDMPSTPTLYL